MSIYYFGELVSEYKTTQKPGSRPSARRFQRVMNSEAVFTEGSLLGKQTSPTLVGDIIKNREDYQALNGRKKFVIRHYQEV